MVESGEPTQSPNPATQYRSHSVTHMLRKNSATSLAGLWQLRRPTMSARGDTAWRRVCRGQDSVQVNLNIFESPLYFRFFSLRLNRRIFFSEAVLLSKSESYLLINSLEIGTSMGKPHVRIPEWSAAAILAGTGSGRDMTVSPWNKNGLYLPCFFDLIESYHLELLLRRIFFLRRFLQGFVRFRQNCIYLWSAKRPRVSSRLYRNQRPIGSQTFVL